MSRSSDRLHSSEAARRATNVAERDHLVARRLAREPLERCILTIEHMTIQRMVTSPGDLAVGSARLRNGAGAVVGELHQSVTITGGRGEPTTELITAGRPTTANPTLA